MITQKEFIKSVSGKKETRQRRFVKLLRLLNHFFPIKIPQYQNRMGDYIYLTICRANDFDMVMASVYTLLKNSLVCPNKIILVSDGSWEPIVGQKYFKNHKLDVEAFKWNTCADFYAKSCPSLKIWAEKHIWGKKMAAILYFSEQYKVLFSDPDVLWYNTPLSQDELKNCKLKLSIDNSHNYDDDFIKSCGFEKLYETEEPINCGAVFIHGGLTLLSEDALRCIEYESEHCGPFAEQTVFAIMDLDYNKRWTMQQITSEISDLLQPFTSHTIFYKDMIARHYLWRLKWIYWKDYYKQRLSDYL